MKALYVPITLVLLIVSSCQRGIYIPDKVNSPGFQQGGEAKFDISVKPQKPDSSGSGLSYSSDISYAPINHLGIIASYRSVNNKAVIEPKFYYGFGRFSKLNGQCIDIGAGYFNTLGTNGKYEAYGGYGNGTLINNGFVDTGINGRTYLNYKARYSRYFIQLAMGFKNEEIVSFMGGFRITLQQYYSFVSDNPEVKYSLVPDQSMDMMKQSFVFFEPYIEVQAGWKYVKFNYQFGCASQVAGPDLKYDLGLPYMTFGIVLYYSPRFFKHNDKVKGPVE